MALLPYDATNGENIFDGTTDLKTPDNAYDPASPNKYKMEAADFADVRDYVEYTRQDTVIGNAKKIDGSDIDTSTAATGDVLQKVASGDYKSQPIELVAQDAIVFNPQSPAPTPEEGQFFYDDDCKCISFVNDKTGSTLNIGREAWRRAIANSGSPITNGMVVFIDGASGGLPTVDLAKANAYSTSRVIAMCTEVTVADSTSGEFTRYGDVNGLDTSSYAPGTELWLSSTTAGEVTDTKPSGSDFAISIGTVLIQDASNGRIDFDPKVAQYAEELNEITGWADRTTQTISFTDGTRTLAIVPTATEFVFYQDGIQYRKTSDSYVIPNEEGLFIIYYDTGSLAYVKNPSDGQVDVLIRNNPTVAYVYWNATAGQSEYVGFELHGALGLYGQSPSSHSYNHFTRGAAYINGSGVGLNTVGTGGAGSAASDAQFGVNSFAFVDEDLPFFPSAVTPTAGTTVKYFLGADADLRSITQAGYSVITDITAGVGSTGRLVYNQLTGGAYQLTVCTDNTYVLCHTFGVNENGSNKIQSVMGLANYGSIDSAFAGAIGELSNIRNSLLPGREWIPIASTIFQTRSSYSNAVKSRLVQTPDGDDYIDWQAGIVAGSGGGGTGTPGGSTTQVQYNDTGSFNGDATFTFNNVTKAVSVTTLSASNINVAGQTVSDILVSTDGTSTSDSALATAGWITENAGGGGGNTVQSITYADPVTPVWASGNIAIIGTLTGDITLANSVVDATAGTYIEVRFQQDATGGRTITLGSDYILLNSNNNYSTTPNAVSIFSGTARADGTIEGGWYPADLGLISATSLQIGGTSPTITTILEAGAGTSTSDSALATAGWIIENAGGAGGGDVTGPASSVDNSVAIFDGVTGKALHGVSESGVIYMPASVRRNSSASELTFFGGDAAGASVSLNGPSHSTYPGQIRMTGNATLAGNLEVNGQAYSTTHTLTDATTIATDCDNGNVFKVTLAGNRTLGAPTNQQDGATYIWRIIQDGTGTRTLSYNSVFKFPGGTAPTLSTGAGDVDIITGVSDGTNVYCQATLDFN